MLVWQQLLINRNIIFYIFGQKICQTLLALPWIIIVGSFQTIISRFTLNKYSHTRIFYWCPNNSSSCRNKKSWYLSDFWLFSNQFNYFQCCYVLTSHVLSTRQLSLNSRTVVLYRNSMLSYFIIRTFWTLLRVIRRVSL